MTSRTYTAFALWTLMLPTAVMAAPVVFEVGGSDDPFSIQTTVDTFRAALGGSNNGNAPGPLPDGRREINWDGGGSTVNEPVATAFDGFLDTRGARFVTPGTGFVQAPAAAAGAGDDLGTFFGNPTYDATFGAFSPTRVFVPIASNILDVRFYVPGTAGGTLAAVAGFGAVFSDVDLDGSAMLEYFDPDGNLLYGSFVETGSVADRSLSFLGAIFTGGERIARVRVTAGTAFLGASTSDDPGHGTDLVALDDFLYSEPFDAAQPVPEPGTWALLGGGVMALLMVAGVRRRRTGTSAS